MNGRIYDPLLGRFLSADILVQAPSNLQSYNRYSYVANNPLSFTDKSGFSINDPNDNELLKKSKANTAAGNNWTAMGYGLAALPKLAFDSTVHVFRNALPQGFAAAKQDLANKNASGKLSGAETAAGRWVLGAAELGTGIPSLVANADRIPKIAAEFPGKVASDVKEVAKNPTVSNVFNVAEDAMVVGGVTKLATAGVKGLGGAIKNAVAADSKAAASAEFTFRGDSRSPDLIFNEGFKARGTSTDLLAHAIDNRSPPSAFVSTSLSADVAASFGDNVYVVRPRGGIDVNAALGDRSPFRTELEIAVPEQIRPADVRAVTLPQEGVSVLNPNFK